MSYRKRLNTRPSISAISVAVAGLMHGYGCGNHKSAVRGEQIVPEEAEEVNEATLPESGDAAVTAGNAKVNFPEGLLPSGLVSVQSTADGPFALVDGATFSAKAYHIVVKNPDGSIAARLEKPLSIEVSYFLTDEQFPEDQWVLEQCDAAGMSSSGGVVNVPGQFVWTSQRNQLVTLTVATRCPDVWLLPALVTKPKEVFARYPIHAVDPLPLALGGAHGCALVSGELAGLHCWGANLKGQVGVIATVSEPPQPVFQVPFQVATRPLSLALGKAHSCAILVDGTVHCWGSDEKGQLGNGAFAVGNSFEATEIDASVFGFNNRFVSLASGDDFSCAVRTDGKVFCWGDNASGQLGDGSTSGAASPKEVSWPDGVGDRPLVVRAGAAHACVITDQERVFCWGNNTSGQVSTVSSEPIIAAPTLVDGVFPVRSGAAPLRLALGREFTCVATIAGVMRCIGMSDHGILGSANGAFTVGSIAALAAGPDHACLLAGDGTVSCWGSHAVGQAASSSECSGQAPCAASPTAVSSLTGQEAVATGGMTDELGRQFDFSCALAGARLSCWGNNRLHQLGGEGEEGMQTHDL